MTPTLGGTDTGEIGHTGQVVGRLQPIRWSTSNVRHQPEDGRQMADAHESLRPADGTEELAVNGALVPFSSRKAAAFADDLYRRADMAGLVHVVCAE